MLSSGLVPNGVDLSGYFDYAGLFCLTRGEAKAEPANQPCVYLYLCPSFSVRDLTEKFARQKLVR